MLQKLALAVAALGRDEAGADDGRTGDAEGGRRRRGVVACGSQNTGSVFGAGGSLGRNGLGDRRGGLYVLVYGLEARLLLGIGYGVGIGLRRRLRLLSVSKINHYIMGDLGRTDDIRNGRRTGNTDDLPVLGARPFPRINNLFTSRTAPSVGVVIIAFPRDSPQLKSIIAARNSVAVASLQLIA